MAYEVRPITADEFPAFVRTTALAFGEAMSDDDVAAERALFEFDRSLAVLDNGHIVATAGGLSFDLTLPGLTIAPAVGVSWIGVLPTHRRRGLLRFLMSRQLGDMRERGEALAILSASESSIYGRFGYGVATHYLRFELDRHHAAFAQPGAPRGQFRLLDRATAATVLPDVYDRARRKQPGALTRSPAWWDNYMRDPESWREGASAHFYVAYEPAPGQVDGYVTYRIESKWNTDLPANVLRMMEMTPVNEEARRALWSYCFNVDLIGSVQARACPVDEPLRWMLADPRRMRVTTLSDSLWVRLVDIPTALTTRRYAGSGRLVLEIADPFMPANGDCYELEVEPDGAACRRTSAAPDMALDVADLGAAYLGGVWFSTLARAGRVVERHSGALHRADALFACEPAPWCATDF